MKTWIVETREIPGALDIRAYREAGPWIRLFFWEAGRWDFRPS